MATTLKYTQDDLQKAVKAVKEDGVSFGDASRLYHVPRATIHNYCKDTVVVKKKRGPVPVLTTDEEGTLENWLLDLARRGYPVTYDGLLDQVQKILRVDGRETSFTEERHLMAF